MSKKILLITEEENLGEDLRKHLEKEGHVLIFEKSAINAASRAEIQNPDLIILDIMLPAMDGIKVLRLLENNEKTKDIKLLLLSVVVIEGKRDSMRLGPVDIIQKPVDFKYLQKIMKEATTGRKVLVADDDPKILKLMKVKLEAEGYNVSTACDGNETLGKIKKQEPDLIITDFVMPEKDGNEIIKETKKFPETKDIPIIVFSGFVQDYYKKENILGARRFLEETFTSKELAEEIIKQL